MVIVPQAEVPSHVMQRDVVDIMGELRQHVLSALKRRSTLSTVTPLKVAKSERDLFNWEEQFQVLTVPREHTVFHHIAILGDHKSMQWLLQNVVGAREKSSKVCIVDRVEAKSLGGCTRLALAGWLPDCR